MSVLGDDSIDVLLWIAEFVLEIPGDTKDY